MYIIIYYKANCKLCVCVIITAMHSEEKKASESKTSESKTIREEKNSSSTSSRSSGPKANSTSTMFLTSTISVPDNDEIILSVSTVLQCQMLNVSSILQLLYFIRSYTIYSIAY